MKKFIAIAIAALSFNAVADHHNKHMVTLGGYTTGNSEDRLLDFSYSQDDQNKKHLLQNIALNYAYALDNHWQVGAFYKNYKVSVDGDVAAGGSTTMGLKAIYNFNGLTDSNYLALSYGIQSFKDDETDTTKTQDGNKNTTIGLEFGHRFSLGTIWGMNFNYSPSVTLSQVTFAPDAAGQKDVKTTAVAVDFVKFDVLF